MQAQQNYNAEQARFNMVEQQIRPWNVSDNKVLDLMNSIAREDFVPKTYATLAYADMSIPLEHSQSMLTPKEIGRILQALNIQSNETLLEVGTGSGYLTALLAHLAKKVYSIDIVSDFIEQAKVKTEQLGLSNIEFEEGDASSGWPHYGPYDLTIISAGVSDLPQSYIKSLKVGGRLFCIEGQKPAMQAKLLTKTAEDKLEETILFETEINPMINLTKDNEFIF